MNKSKKRLFTKIAVVTLIYELIFQGGGALLISYGSNIYSNEYISMIASSITALTVALLLLGITDVNISYKSFGPLKFMWLLLIVYGIQGLTSYIMNPFVDWLASHGYELGSSMDAASKTDLTNIFDIIYAVLMAPLFEELLYRGLIYGNLRRYGRIFAIIITALLFGLMHINIIQLLPAFLIGVVLAWTREAYGIQYSIMIHMSNNLLAIVLNEFAVDHTLITALYMFLIFGGMITVFVTVIKNFTKIIRDINHEQELGSNLKAWFTTAPVVIITAFYLILTVVTIIL